MARLRRKTKRFFRRVLMAMPVLLLAAFLYVWMRPPSRAAASSIHVEMSPDRIERGRYLFTALSGCDACHSERDFSKADGPVVVSGRGKGQVMQMRDLPGNIVAPNITPDRETGIGSWTDGEKIRAIRDGVAKDGHALFPLMPYPSYRSMTDEDVESLVAFMNTLPPVRNYMPPSNVGFASSILMKGLPRPVGSVPPEDPDGGEIYGEYLATIAACVDCHTPTSRLEPDSSLLFAGGRLFQTPSGTVYSSNITPDRQTGIGAWNYQRFATRMHSFRDFGRAGPPAAKPDQFTWMPWEGYAQLTDHDLEALFLYLRALKPIAHAVQVHPGTL